MKLCSWREEHLIAKETKFRPFKESIVDSFEADDYPRQLTYTTNSIPGF